MENRFGFKDFITLLLLVAVVAMLALKMVQDDRQWEKFSQIQTSVQQQTNDVAALRRAVADGAGRATVQTPTDVAGTSESDAVFRRVKEAQKQKDYARGDWSVESFSVAVPTLNPLMAQDLYSRIVQARVLQALGTTDYDTLETIPLLAKSWQKAPDGLSAIVQLRDGVTFSDGHPFTADDVVFSFEIRMDPNISEGRDREYYKSIKKVEKLGPLEVKFHFERFYEAFDRAMGIFIIPKHLFAKYSAQQIRDNVALLMGTGPYRLPDPEHFSPDQPIELVRNERYWGEPGPWDRMIYRTIEKNSTELVAFRNREIDGIPAVPEQHVEMLKDADLLKNKQYFVYDSARLGYSYIAWNQKRGGQPTVFADKRVRQAMTMLIDRQTLLDQIFLGYGKICTAPFSDLTDQYDKSIKPWPYDTARGVALLKDAGFKVKADGTMLKPDGTPFEPELSYPSGNEFTEKIVLFLHDNLARAGINLRLHPVKWTVFIKNLNEKDFEAITLRWSGDLEDDPQQAFHSSSIKDGDNRNSYSSPELDKLIDKAYVTLDRAERMRVWQACHRVIHEDQPYTFLIRSSAILWLDNRIKNVQTVPVIGLNSVSLWPNPIEWYVPKGLQLRGK